MHTTNTTSASVSIVSTVAKNPATFISAEIIASNKAIAAVASKVTSGFLPEMRSSMNGVYLTLAFALNRRDDFVTVESLAAAGAGMDRCSVKSLAWNINAEVAASKKADHLAAMAALKK